MVIYKATNKINGKCYIGQTKLSLKRRICAHVTIKDHNNYFHNAIKKYGIENFKWTILEICFTQKELDEKEEMYIKHFESFGPKGYNLTSGGAGVKKIVHSQMTKDIISKTHKGKILSSETKKKISNSKKNVKKGPMSEYQKKKISDSIKGEKHPFYGKKHNSESKKKMSNSAKGRVPWNKGLTISDERVKKYIENRKSKKGN